MDALSLHLASDILIKSGGIDEINELYTASTV
jgi:hypothetical protein